MEERMCESQCLVVLALAPAVQAARDVVDIVPGKEAVLEALNVVLGQPGAVVGGLVVGVRAQETGSEEQRKQEESSQHSLEHGA